MSRWEKYALGALLYGTTCAGALNGQTEPAAAVWYIPMLDKLSAIADTATIEHYRCLLGAMRGDTIYVLAALEPKIAAASPVGVRLAEWCPPLLTVGEWHNHIPADLTMQGEVVGHSPPAMYCELAPHDTIPAGGPLPFLFQVITVNKDVSCAWMLVGDTYQRLLEWPPRAEP